MEHDRTSPLRAGPGQNWRGKPLTSSAVILTLIAATTTEAGLMVACQLDTNPYPAGRNISDAEMATLSPTRLLPRRMELSHFVSDHFH